MKNTYKGIIMYFFCLIVGLLSPNKTLGQTTALVSSNWRLESLQYKSFNKAGEFGVSPPKLTLFQGYRELQRELF